MSYSNIARDVAAGWIADIHTNDHSAAIAPTASGCPRPLPLDFIEMQPPRRGQRRVPQCVTVVVKKRATASGITKVRSPASESTRTQVTLVAFRCIVARNSALRS